MEQMRDRVRQQGVKRKGYGILPSFVMLDMDLMPEARALYGHLAAYAGNGDSAYPSRNRIMFEMHLGKNAYYKYLNQLIDFGYVEVEQKKQTNEEGGKYLQNIYTLIYCPLRFKEAMLKKGYSEEEIEDSGLELDGYGIIPKLVITDSRLRIRTKALYCYYAVFSGTRAKCNPDNKHLRYHLKMGYDAYLKSQRELAHFQYVRLEQGRKGGQYQSTVVTLVQSDVAGVPLEDITGDPALVTSAKPLDKAVLSPDAEKGDTVFQPTKPSKSEAKFASDTDLGDTGKGDGKNAPDSRIGDTGIGDTGKGDTNINKYNINNININKTEDSYSKNPFQEKNNLSTLLKKLPTDKQLMWLHILKVMSHVSLKPTIKFVLQTYLEMYQEAQNDKAILEQIDLVSVEYLICLIEALFKGQRNILYPTGYIRTSLLNAAHGAKERNMMMDCQS